MNFHDREEQKKNLSILSTAQTIAVIRYYTYSQPTLNFSRKQEFSTFQQTHPKEMQKPAPRTQSWKSFPQPVTFPGKATQKICPYDF